MVITPIPIIGRATGFNYTTGWGAQRGITMLVFENSVPKTTHQSRIKFMSGCPFRWSNDSPVPQADWDHMSDEERRATMGVDSEVMYQSRVEEWKRGFYPLGDTMRIPLLSYEGEADMDEKEQPSDVDRGLSPGVTFRSKLPSYENYDNWRHRAANMRCRTCMYFMKKVPLQQAGEERANPLGRCRRNAPTIKGWPAIFADDWCGEHKLDENKI